MGNETNKRKYGIYDLKKDKSPEIIRGLEACAGVVAAGVIKFVKSEKGKKLMADSAKSVAKVIKNYSK